MPGVHEDWIQELISFNYLNPKCGCFYIVQLLITFKNRRRANKTYHPTIFKPKSVLYLLCL